MFFCCRPVQPGLRVVEPVATRVVAAEDRIVHNEINACKMITDSAVNTIRYGIQLPRLEKSNRNVV